MELAPFFVSNRTHSPFNIQDLFHVRVTGAVSEDTARILTPDALLFLEELENKFGERRRALIRNRHLRRARIALRQENLGLLTETEDIRSSAWKVARAPADLMDRTVEITGPAERKMMINALNSGSNVFMADLEDALSPTWENVVSGQVALKEAVRHTLRYRSAEGRDYKLQTNIATLVVRPRGWHLEEKNIRFDGRAISASLVDFGLYFFHNANELLRRGSGPYFYLPKIESHLEARLWNDVFIFAQERLAIPRGTIRATILIETISAAFEMDEILFELREHASGLNAGRWDYLFSIIKTFADSGELTFPDRDQLTMNIPFMRAYARRLVATCHKRGAQAIGGMAAFIPSRKDSEINALAFAKVKEDKAREASDGFNGTWVAHPDLVPLVRSVFAEKSVHEKTWIEPALMIPHAVAGSRVTDHGVSQQISVSLQYLSSWLQGQGAVAIHSLMEDAATAEISRSLLWSWVKQKVVLAEGARLTRDEFRRRLVVECTSFAGRATRNRIAQAAQILEEVVLSEEFPEFLTLKAYELIQ